MSAAIKLNDNQRKVLCILAGITEGYSMPFAPIARRTGLPVPQIRLACRSMKRKGLTEFHTGLWHEDGGPAGSGYCATKSGRELVGADAVEEYVD